MHRRDFMISATSACSCCLLPSTALAEKTDSFLDFCTELSLDPSESATWVQNEWEEAPQNDEEAAAIKAKRWKPSRKTLNVDFLNEPDDAQLKDRVISAAAGWHDFMDLEFRFGAAEPEILVNFGPGRGHWSYLGTDSLGKARQGQASMNFGWSGSPPRDRDLRRVVLHEFGHAMSLIHEHSSPAAAIPWDRDAVYEYYRRTQGWDDAKIERNIFARYSESSVNRTRYDPDSIMHYPIPRELVTDPLYATTWNTRLSSGDEAMANFLFPA